MHLSGAAAAFEITYFFNLSPPKAALYTWIPQFVVAIACHEIFLPSLDIEHIFRRKDILLRQAENDIAVWPSSIVTDWKQPRYEAVRRFGQDCESNWRRHFTQKHLRILTNMALCASIVAHEGVITTTAADSAHHRLIRVIASCSHLCLPLCGGALVVIGFGPFQICSLFRHA